MKDVKMLLILEWLLRKSHRVISEYRTIQEPEIEMLQLGKKTDRVGKKCPDYKFYKFDDVLMTEP